MKNALSVFLFHFCSLLFLCDQFCFFAWLVPLFGFKTSHPDSSR